MRSYVRVTAPIYNMQGQFTEMVLTVQNGTAPKELPILILYSLFEPVQDAFLIDGECS